MQTIENEIRAALSGAKQIKKVSSWGKEEAEEIC